ncbi:uncharacterized protein LOC122312470 isoform X1 [Carya illinoinensis]|uniref:uncharacterized protein LOC122312470 isoform X1 n=1 Tax=Carya illinoinensis TaxID=32201 RepID=UPI001C724649|nr:uncharacterized protein LOC122312470 isoform X1 [Carya illinoinensis]
MDGEGSGPAGCSPGSIVWVRRRNGSWWPGKILGPEELGASHLTSPRSGTPVKLLGREDASVDWYNLEKSKRVKAFRCGEFDECIEKAESSQGMPIKKREKYARREDAILHALELEKQLLEKQGNFGIDSDRTSKKLSGGLKKSLVSCSESHGDDNGKHGNSNSHQFPSRLETYHNDKSIGGGLSSKKAIDGNQLSGDEDHSEIVPRMRGLQDFGLRITPSKQRLLSSVASNGSRKSTVEHHADALPGGGVLSMGNASQANGKLSWHKGLTKGLLVNRCDMHCPLIQGLQSCTKLGVPHSLLPDYSAVSTSISGVEQMGVTSRAKRSRSLYLTAEHGDSFDCGETSQSHIVMSTSQFRVNCLPHPGSLIEENSSAFTEEVDDSSETNSSDSASDSSETEPEIDEETTLLSEWNALGRSEAQEHGSMNIEEHDGLTFLGDTSHLYLHDHVSANDAMSKWRLKGKRNIRNITKRSVNASDGKGSIHGTYSEEKGSGLRQRTLRQNLSFHRNDDFDYSVDDDDDAEDEDDDDNISERDFGSQKVKMDSRYSLASRAASRGRNSVARNMADWEDLTWEDQSALRGYWGVKAERFDPYFNAHRRFGGRPRSMLVNVDLKVQASYQKEPVPIVSLMSKLNGKAIIGHPIQIEALEDGSAETLLSTVDFGNEVFNNENTALQPAWRTARRTANFRVPRPHLSSVLEGDEAAHDIPFLGQEMKPPLKKLNVGSFSYKPCPDRSNLPLVPRPQTDLKILKKPPKKVSLSSSQKTRTLSSIATEQNFSIKPIQDGNSGLMDGLIKPESSGHTTVACIPVKLVFSRLLEKINRPPSKAASKAVLLNGDVERNQS